MQVSGDWMSNTATQSVCAALTDAGHQALFVGGCVRNALLGAPVADIDIATDARPDDVIRLAKAAGLKAIPTGIEHGTVTVVAEKIPHEITTFRRDEETDGRHAVISFSEDIREDARRRDFTMNALYAHSDGTVVDPLGGYADLTARRLRFIDDAGARIREDHLRILRFFRFHAWYGDPAGGLDEDALAAIAQHIENLAALSKERVGAEVMKLLSAPDPAPAVAAMHATGALGAVLQGSDPRALAPLVHLEGENDIAPDARRRLAALGGSVMAESLRLSNKNTKQLELLRDQIGAATSAHALGYLFGAETAHDILLLRAAMLEAPFGEGEFASAALGSEAKFPIAAKDLMPKYQGVALGEKLKALEAIWIASRFEQDRKQLLGQLDDDL